MNTFFPGFQSKAARTFKLLSLLLVSLTFIEPVSAEVLYRVDYEGTFEGGFGGLPLIQMQGSYTFARVPATHPPDYYEQVIMPVSQTAYYNAIRSGSFTLNGTNYTGSLSNSEIRVDNNLPIAPGLKRDGYQSFITLEGNLTENISLLGAGLEFEQRASSPSALNSLALPTSVSDLSGFKHGEVGSFNAYGALLSYKDTNGSYAIYSPLESLTITPVADVDIVIYKNNIFERQSGAGITSNLRRAGWTLFDTLNTTGTNGLVIILAGGIGGKEFTVNPVESWSKLPVSARPNQYDDVLAVYSGAAEGLRAKGTIRAVELGTDMSNLAKTFTVTGMRLVEPWAGVPNSFVEYRGNLVLDTVNTLAAKDQGLNMAESIDLLRNILLSQGYTEREMNSSE